MSSIMNLIRIENVKGYVDENNMAWCDAESICRGLGFVMIETQNKILSTSGKNKKYSINVVRWKRVNKYLKEFGYDKEINKESYIPENIVYLLAMKAKSKVAKEFQFKLANEILPSIRKYGVYIDNKHKVIRYATKEIRNFEESYINRFYKYYNDITPIDKDYVFSIISNIANKFSNIETGKRDEASSIDLIALILIETKISYILDYYMRRNTKPETILRLLYKIIMDYSDEIYYKIKNNDLNVKIKKRKIVINDGILRIKLKIDPNKKKK